MTVFEARAHIVRRLAHTGEAAAEAAEILSHLTGLSYTEQITRGGTSFLRWNDLRRILEKREDGTPLAYAIGKKYFCGLPFDVDSSVLIPRLDSECVVLEAVRLVRDCGYESLLDLCCGSGCLGISVASSCGVDSVAFADISRDALKTAEKNVRALLKLPGAPFFESDLFDSVEGRFDLIVCNPPYISEAEYAVLESAVRNYEPKAALLAGPAGTEFYSRICRLAEAYLNPGGAVVFEIGFNQPDTVMAIMRNNGMVVTNSGKDLGGRPRFISGAYL